MMVELMLLICVICIYKCLYIYILYTWCQFATPVHYIQRSHQSEERTHTYNTHCRSPPFQRVTLRIIITVSVQPLPIYERTAFSIFCIIIMYIHHIEHPCGFFSFIIFIQKSQQFWWFSSDFDGSEEGSSDSLQKNCNRKLGKSSKEYPKKIIKNPSDIWWPMRISFRWREKLKIDWSIDQSNLLHRFILTNLLGV